MDASELAPSIEGVLFEQPYEELLPKLMALAPEEITPVNLSIPSAVAKALGVRPVVLGLKDRISETLPRTERDLPENLTAYALALSHSHTLYSMATRSSDPVPDLAEEGMKLRSLLLSDAEALIHRGFVLRDALRGYKGSVGYTNLAFDLQMLVQLFRECPQSGRAQSAAAAVELERAEQIAATILRALRKRTRPDPKLKAAADVRNRAFTLFTRAYDQLRRAVAFLRWSEGDADQLIPSLYRKRTRPKKDGSETPAWTAPTSGSSTDATKTCSPSQTRSACSVRSHR